MARFFFSLSSRPSALGLSTAGFLSLAVICATELRAESPTASTNAAPKTASAPTGVSKTAPTPPAPTATTNTAAKPAPPVPDSFNRYGKIWVPSSDVAHPLQLNTHFPGVSEIRIPSQDDLNDRDKLEQLTMLSDAEIHKQLDQWPPYSKMKLGDQGQLLLHIQMFREQRTKIAMDKAHELGILDTMTPDQKVRFEKDYWDQRRQMDHDEVKQMEPILKTWEQKMDEELFSKYSSASPGPVVQAPKPPAPGQPPANKPPQAPAPTAPQIKAAASAPAPAHTSPTTNAAPPIAQAPR